MSGSERSTPHDVLRESFEAVYQDSQADYYDFDTRRWPHNRYEAILRVAPSAQRLLDIGCGNGLLLYNLRSRASELYGVELARNRAAVAERGLAAVGIPCEVTTGNVEQGLPFPDGHFDGIVWAEVLQYVIDLWAAMAEVQRLLSPGGYLVTTFPNIASLRRRIALLRGRFPATSAPEEGFAVRPGGLYDEGTLHYFTVSTLKRLYDRYGIAPVRQFGFGRLGRLHNLQPSLLSSGICLLGVKPLPP